MKIKSSFTVPTKDFRKWESMELPVEVTFPDEGLVYSDPEYKVVIPDFMFNELADTEPRFRTKHDINNRSAIFGCFAERSITTKFQKTQVSKLLSTLHSYFNELTTIINDRHSLETATLKKKIFINFQHNQSHTTNGLNNAYTGEVINQSFRFFTGYEVFTDQFQNLTFESERKPRKYYITKILYASPGSSVRKLDTGFQEKEDLFIPLPGHNESVESFESKYSIIDWTQEREDFCKKIQAKFEEVNRELSFFLTNISEKKMDALMSGNGLKFLNA